MALSGVEVPKMNWDGENLRENWRRFKQHAELMFTGPLKNRSEAEKCSYLLIWSGQKGRDIFNTWKDINEEDKVKLETYYDKFEQHVNPRSNPVFARYKFHQKIQGVEESVEHFITEIQILAQDCEFPNKDEMIRDRIVFGTNSRKIREKLFDEGPDLTLEKAITVARSYETSQAQLNVMSPGINIKEEKIQAISRTHSKRNSPDKHVGSTQGAQRQAVKFTQDAQRGSFQKKTDCYNCGRSHSRYEICPAKGQICNYCKKKNHFAQVCRAKIKSKQKIHSLQNTSHTADEAFETLAFESICIGNINGNPSVNKDEVYATINIDLPGKNKDNTTLKVKLDTGAQGNVLPLRLYRKMYSQNINNNGTPKFGALTQSKVTLVAYGGSVIKHHGTVKIPCYFNDNNETATFYVTDTAGPAIMGLNTATKLNLLKFNMEVKEESPQRNIQPKPRNLQSDTIKDKQDLITKYPECFNGIGKFQGEYHITLDPSVPPVIHPPRKVPISLKDDIKRELDDMVKNNVIAKIQEGEPTAWVNSLVYRRKPNGKLRLCLDPKDLNAAIKREHHVTPTLEEILPKLSGAEIFSIVDAKCGYWNVVLDEESSYLTTFNSPFGRYRF